MKRGGRGWVELAPGTFFRDDIWMWTSPPPEPGWVPVDVSGWQPAGYVTDDAEVPRCFRRPDFGPVRGAAEGAS